VHLLGEEAGERRPVAEGSPVSTAIRRTTPSVRKKLASNSRPALAALLQGRAGRAEDEAEGAEQVLAPYPTGSAKRRSTMQAATARRGVRRVSSRPVTRRSRVASSLSEAGDEDVARPGREIADRLQPGAGEGEGDGGIDAEGR
jgi:hypothetical protein